MTPLISVLIIPGAVSTAVNMVTAMVKRICNGIEKRLLKKGLNISRKQDALHSKFFTCNDIFHRIIDEEAFTW